MITIFGLDENVAESMTEVFGERIFNHKVSNSEGECTATLHDYAEIKFYNFDQSITVQLGSKKYIIESENYWRMELE